MHTLRHTTLRRIFSASLIVIGGVLMFLAPPEVWLGPVLLMFGIAIELLAFALLHFKNGKTIAEKNERSP